MVLINTQYMSEDDFRRELEKIQLKNRHKEMTRALRKEKLRGLPKIKLPSTSKLILLGAVLLCLEIVIFCEYVMYNLGDTSALYVLVGIPATLIPIIWGYYSKSKAENTVGGITYDMAMKEYQDYLDKGSNETDVNSTPVG